MDPNAWIEALDRLQVIVDGFADEYAAVHRQWSEAFLRHKMGSPPKGQTHITDGQAKAMADIDVDEFRLGLGWQALMMLGELSASALRFHAPRAQDE